MERKEEVTVEQHTDNIVPINYPDGGLRAWLVVLACFLGMVTDYGLYNSIGAIESYVEEHILVHNTSTEIAWIFSIYCFMTFSASLAGGIVFDKYGAKLLVVAGTVLMVGGLFATANSRTLWQFIMSFSVCTGLGCALLTPPCVNAVSHFFFKRRGLAMGISISGASVGGVAWPLMCRYLYAEIGFVWTMRTLAFVFLALMAVGIACIDDRRDEIRLSYPVEKKPPQPTSLIGRLWHTLYLDQVIDFTLLKNPAYDFLVVALAMNELSLVIAFTYTPSYAIDRGFGQSIGLICLTVLNAAGIPGRYIPTILSDRLGNFNMICCMSLMMTVAISVIWLPFGQHLPAFLIFVVVYGFSVAGTLAITPLCTAAVSTPQNYGKAYSTAYFFASFGNLAGLPIGMAVTATSAGYQAMVGFCAATCAVSTLFFVLSRLKLGGVKWIVI